MAAAAPILLTLCAGALVGHLPVRGRTALGLPDVPAYAAEFLGYRGLNAPTSLLRGLTEAQLRHLAHRADQAGCPFLAIVDDSPMLFSGDSIDGSAERLERLLLAARALGAAQVGIRIPCEGDDTEVSRIARSVRETLESVARHEVMLLLRPCAPGLADTERFTAFIQRIGGFRIGGMASSDLLQGPDELASLRRLAPYSGCVRLLPPLRRGKPDRPYIQSFMVALGAVGYQSSLCVTVPAGKDAAKVLEATGALIRGCLEPAARHIGVGAAGGVEADADAPAEA
ncbi:MAG: hypothetical protein O2819_01265 [Planctomycetota bacterium]|nr:hypothetical protein [Planctomycetota bacterium]MDA1104979.1 hypothetical protein [Planctomycetota bacterium]